jgi:hypothetical protein
VSVNAGDEWSRLQLALIRTYISGEIDSHEFGRDFMAAHNAAARLGELADEPLEELLEDVLFALSNHSNEPDPDVAALLDDAQLREKLTRQVAEWEKAEGT